MKRALIPIAFLAFLAGCAFTADGPQVSAIPPAMQGTDDVQGDARYPAPAPPAGIGTGIGTGVWGSGGGTFRQD